MRKREVAERREEVIDEKEVRRRAKDKQRECLGKNKSIIDSSTSSSPPFTLFVTIKIM